MLLRTVFRISYTHKRRSYCLFAPWDIKIAVLIAARLVVLSVESFAGNGKNRVVNPEGLVEQGGQLEAPSDYITLRQ